MRKVYVTVVADVLITCAENENFDDVMENFNVLVDLGDDGELGDAEVLEFKTEVYDSK